MRCERNYNFQIVWHDEALPYFCPDGLIMFQLSYGPGLVSG